MVINAKESNFGSHQYFYMRIESEGRFTIKAIISGEILPASKIVKETVIKETGSVFDEGVKSLLKNKSLITLESPRTHKLRQYLTYRELDDGVRQDLTRQRSMKLLSAQQKKTKIQEDYRSGLLEKRGKWDEFRAKRQQVFK